MFANIMADVEVINAMVDGWGNATIPRKQDLESFDAVMVCQCMYFFVFLCNLHQEKFVRVDNIKMSAADYAVKEDAMQKNLNVLQKHLADLYINQTFHSATALKCFGLLGNVL